MFRFILVLVLVHLNVPVMYSQASPTVYGMSGNDITKANKMISFTDGSQIWAGEWNNKGVFMKVKSTGDEIKRLYVNLDTSSQVRIKDMVRDVDGTIVAVGECRNCFKNDSIRRILAVRVDSTLSSIINYKIYATATSGAYLTSPFIERKNNTLMILAVLATTSYQDMQLLSINKQLDTIWTKSMNSCVECFSEISIDITATSSGFVMALGHAFTDTATIYHIDTLGNVRWKVRSFTFNGIFGGALAYSNGKIYIGIGVNGTPYDYSFYTAIIQTLSESTGSVLAITNINDPFSDRYISSLEVAPNGNLIVGYIRVTYTFTGYLISSQILIINPNTSPSTLAGSITIPNPGDSVNMTIAHAISLNSTGTSIGGVGTRGLTGRAFYLNYNLTTPVTNVSIQNIDFTIYPNPASFHQEVNIKLPNKVLELHYLQIYDIKGVRIFETKLSAEERNYTLPILSRGIYTVKIIGKTDMGVKKLIVE